MKLNDLERQVGGGCEIRTHGRLATSPVFKTGALNHSANPPAVDALARWRTPRRCFRSTGFYRLSSGPPRAAPPRDARSRGLARSFLLREYCRHEIHERPHARRALVA